MFKCTTKSYDVLYSRWLENPGNLLDLAEFDESKDSLLDLCGGTGAVSVEAVLRGAVLPPTLIDLNPRCSNPRVKSIKGDAHDPLTYRDVKADVCIIRQSLGYLDLKTVFSLVHGVLNPGGRFAFNTFLQPRWKVSTYRHGGRRHFEVSAHALGKVVHVQASPLVGLDVSVFKHHGLDDIMNALKRKFDVDVADGNQKSVRVCAVKRM